MVISKKEFGDYVRRRREALGMKQTELAKLIKVSNVTLNRWEMGVITPPEAMRDHVIRVLEEQRQR